MGDGGGPLTSPWLWEAGDHLDRKIRISVTFNTTTLILNTATVTRDSGCLFTKIVFDVPSDGVKSKRLQAPANGAGPNTYSRAQMSSQGLDTVTDLNAVQCTAER